MRCRGSELGPRLALALLVSMLGACKRAPEQSSPGATSHTGPANTSSSVTRPVPSSVTTPGATAVAAPMGSVDPGCRSDSDCVATYITGTCCLMYCEGFPVSRWEQQRREAATANCPPGEECPPPAPCPHVDYRIEAVCKAGECVAKRVPAQ